LETLGLSTTPPAASASSNYPRSCRICRASLTSNDEFCGASGAQNPTSGSVKCGKCGAAVPVDQGLCSKCNPLAHRPAAGSVLPSTLSVPQTGNSDSFRSVSQYYQEDFAKMQANSGCEGKWNWAAFFWGGLWALTKGLWGQVLLCLVILIITAPIGGLPALLLWFYFGARGNSTFYKKVVLRQQWAFW
jgi:hypothetical protein